MKREGENERLLNDVFAEGVSLGLREAMLSQSVRQARRVRGFRRAIRSTALVAAVGMVVVLIWQSTAHHPKLLSHEQQKDVEKSYTLVRTQPLASAAIVTTRPLIEGRDSAAMEPIQIVRTAPRNFRVINDDELLSLMSPRKCGLIKIGPNSEALVFANPDDAKGLQ